MSGNKFSKIIKIALISILAIIVVSVIIAIINSSHSPVETSSNSKVDIENEQQKHYDFLDNENLTFKFTEKEFIEKFAKIINTNVNDLSITRRTDGFISYSKTSSSAEAMAIGVKTSKLNNKVTDIEGEYHSLVNYIDDEALNELGVRVITHIGFIILEYDEEKYASNGYSEEEKALIEDKFRELTSCGGRDEGLSIKLNYGGQGQISTVKVKCSVIQ